MWNTHLQPATMEAVLISKQDNVRGVELNLFDYKEELDFLHEKTKICLHMLGINTKNREKKLKTFCNQSNKNSSTLKRDNKYVIKYKKLMTRKKEVLAIICEMNKNNKFIRRELGIRRGWMNPICFQYTSEGITFFRWKDVGRKRAFKEHLI